ncbi:MAG TPA: efflux RND transporter periplasmic adaptor subunit [Rhodopila sp.]
MPRAYPSPFALLATVAALGLSGCKPDQAADVRTQDRTVQTVAVRPAGEVTHAYTGVVAARVQSDLGFRVPGKVVARLVDTGQVVTQGQPLLRIDPTDYSHAVTVQAGDVAAARARWVQAAADEKRYRGLVATGATAQITYDQAKAAADSARALLSAAEAQEKVARNQGDYSVLLADADGTVVETVAEPGQVVAAGQSVIRLAHAGPREAAIDLPETERPALGATAEASLYGGAVKVPAQLRQLSDAADPRTRTFEARYVLEGAGAQAPLGATVTLRLAQGRDGDRLEVPLGAIDDEGKGPGIWVVDPSTSKVAYRPVELLQLGGEIAILGKGARPGEQVVAAGGHELHDGERVRVVDGKAVMR